MGLASSQARMLLLTARKSDLEYRAQMISQRKINLAMQTQELATKYSQSMSNRTMNFVFTTSDNQAVTESLSYAGITANNNYAIGNYLVTTASGKYVYSGNTQEEQTQDFYKVALKLAEADGSFEKYATKDSNGKTTITNAQELYNAYKDKMTCVPGLSNDKYFQESLRNGGLFLQKAEMSADGTMSGDGYKNIAWSSAGSIQDALDTSDDAAAQAEYEAKTIVLSNQDKMLDLELNQIETQHKAIETEYDSVKKVIQKNIEVSYKIFA